MLLFDSNVAFVGLLLWLVVVCSGWLVKGVEATKFVRKQTVRKPPNRNVSSSSSFANQLHLHRHQNQNLLHENHNNSTFNWLQPMKLAKHKPVYQGHGGSSTTTFYFLFFTCLVFFSIFVLVFFYKSCLSLYI